ncbi:uncharacterized protein J4E87_009469 [Alternaria ethzedia]|uniref:uncharacterized protein n=1 Tax=Alternaria ethzedia TaxID=181014 RepID=UPI0020C20D5B|nr:uncharacterized protein J4E87_009469 [Alternaria ethzedia]KAI4614668.1 hypothetical protein J4E87_009469 [Alternaria ethzedia]
MAPPRTNPLKEARSCLTLFTHSRSTRWPSRTGLATDILLFLSILFAVAQLGLCVAMAHRLLTSPQSEVDCLNVDAGSNFDFTKYGIYGDTYGIVLTSDVKTLPVLYANVDREKFWHGMDVGINSTDPGLTGPEYLSGKERGGVFTIIAILIFNPLLLVVDLLLLLRSHYRSARISNRAGMLWSTCLAIYFVLVALGTVWMNTFPSSKIDYRLEHTVALTRDSCWQYDKTMYTLDRWSRWAKGIERGCEVLGLLGAVCMAIYFGFALAAAYINRKTDAQQSMRLDDLSGASSLTPAQQNLRDFPSSSLGAHATPVPLNNFGLTFIDGTPGQQPKTATSRASPEDLEAHTNPFTDPANLIRDGDVVPPEPARQWR